MRLIIYSACVLAALLWSSGASGYSVCTTGGGKEIKWQTPEATYLINASGGPSGTVTAVQEGMQAWTDAAASGFMFYYGGTTASTAHGVNDGSNIVTFGTLPTGTVAENRYWYKTLPPNREGELLDSDVKFNTYYSWSTAGLPGAFDVQNVGAHEHGHSLCLVDLYNGADSEKTMYGYVSAGETKKRTLDPDDIDGIAYLYACPYSPARINGTALEYDLLQDAYDNAAPDDIVLGHASVFQEDLFIDLNKTVFLEAGFSCEYSAIVGATTIKGTLSITDGTLIISDGQLVVQ